jgi:multicomponent Na+:H+ antiporter subunit D
MNNAAALPVLLPIGAALLTLLRPKQSPVRRTFVAGTFAALLVAALGLAAHVADHGALVLRVGAWPVPFGIVLVVDTLAAIMLGLSALTALACSVYGYAEESFAREHPLRLPLWLFLIAGINLSFVTGDLFNLFVAFEIMLLASYGLLTLESDARESRGALPYLMINLVGSAVFLATCGLAYSLFGTLNFAEMIVRADQLAGDPRLTLLGLLLLLVFGLKAGVFPLYYWLPTSYPILPAPLAAFFAGMLTKVGVYVLMRIFGTVFPASEYALHQLIAWTAGFTMIVGVLGAVGQSRVQVILSYHIVSQIGFMVLAIGLHSVAAFVAAIFYVIHHIVVKASLFLAGGIVIRASGTDDLARTGGLWRAAPWLGLFFLLQAMSLAGIPPLSGFWGKLMIVQEGFVQREWVLVTLSLVASVLTMMSMLKIWLGAFWKKAPADGPRVDTGARRMSAVGVAMLAVSLSIGLGAEFFIRAATRAAHETLDRPGYVRAVTGANSTLYPGKHP